MKNKGIRLIETYPTKPEANDAMLAYAKLLYERQDTERFGVFIEPIPAAFCWGVFLRDRVYAVPARDTARSRPKSGRVNDE